MRLKKRLAIIGAGEAAKPYLDKAKEKGIYTVCFGQYADSLYREECDQFVDTSVFDVERIVSVCQALKVDGIVPSSEITTESAALAAHRLRLPGNDVTGGFAARNKYRMRQRVAAVTSVKQPRFWLHDSEEVYPFPVVVKAVDSCGKRGVTLVRTHEEWQEAVAYAADHSSAGQVLIEEYIAGGQEYSVECLSCEKRHQIVQITEKDSSGPPHFIEIGHHQPAHLDDLARYKIERATWEILDCLGLHSGMAHLELKLKDDNVYFIEVGARGGGGRIADTLVGLSTDFDYFGAAIDVALGQYTYRPSYAVCHAGIYFLCKQTEHLLPLFETAKTADWCHEYSFKNKKLQEVVIKTDDVLSGHFIYTGYRKITEEDAR